MVRLILSVYSFFSHRRRLLYVLLGVLVAALAVAALRIRFNEDISGFLPSGNGMERFQQAYERFGTAGGLVVSVSGAADTAAATDRETIVAAVDHFAGLLQAADTSGVWIKSVTYRVDQQQMLAVSQFMVENMPYFLTEADYRRMDTLLTEENIRRQLTGNRRMLMSPAGMLMQRSIMADPLHLMAPVLEGLRVFEAGKGFDLYDDHIFSGDGREGIITIESQYPVSETRRNAELLQLIEKASESTQRAFEGKVKVHCFGAAAIAVSNADRIKRDSMISSGLSIILILIILICAFRSAGNLLVMTGSLVFGWLFALGVLSLISDEVSLIAVGISSVIIGIAMNYPLHFILHHRHVPRIRSVIKDIAVPLTIGNITTVGAFLSLLFISSDAMRDLGLFASLLLVGTIGFVLVFLPHLIKNSRPAGVRVPGRLSAWTPGRSKWMVWGFIVLSAGFCILSFDTEFETDMQKINYMPEEQQAHLDRLLATVDGEQQTVYFVSEGATLDGALMAYEASMPGLDSLLAAGTLSKISGLGVYLPSKAMQRERIARWETFCESKREMLARIETIGIETGFSAGAFRIFSGITAAGYTVQDIDYFAPVMQAFARNYTVNEPDGSMVITLLHAADSAPETLTVTLNAISGESFAFGSGDFGHHMVSTLSTDLNRVLFICGLIVFVFLTVTLGRVELSIMAFIPLTVGWFWILGIMNIFDIRFNIVNIILASFIFGQGDDYTIFMTEGLMYEYAYRRKLLASYKNSIILSALIMFVGIGTLILARHPALRSLAEVTIIGMASVVLMTFVLPPFIFRWLTHRKGRRRLMPVTIANLATSSLALIFFLAGSAIANITGFCLFTLGKSTDSKKLRYHRLICRFARFVTVRIPRVKTTYSAFDRTVFDKPAVIICNHQSHIDLMCVMSLTPKLIILTNDWVWNSPVYGRMLRYADFYPVSSGIHNALGKLRAMVAKGYSVLIFPEGTRSDDCRIRRFHRGAFFLAEQLRLDIIPVLLHGAGHILPKEEPVLRRGAIHISVKPRIACNSIAPGTTLAERARHMRRYYTDAYAALAAEIETANYYADLVLHNYIYKGASVERAVRRNLKKYGNYSEVIAQLKGFRRVLIVNCGYGELPLLLSLVHKSMYIAATDADTDKIELAANCTRVGKNLHYAENVATGEQFDATVLINPSEEQRTVWNSAEGVFCITVE